MKRVKTVKEKEVKIKSEKIVRKNLIGSFIRRALWIMVSVAIVLCVIIFFVGEMESSANTTKNQFSNEYWEKLEGFKTYQEYANETLKYDMTSKEYILPYQKNATDEEKVRSARYLEEGKKITAGFNAKLNETQLLYNKLIDVFKGTKAEWLYIVLGVNTFTSYSETIEKDVLSMGCTLTEQQITALIASRKNVFETIVKSGYTGSITHFLEVCIGNSKLETSSYKSAVASGYKKTINEWVLETAGIALETTSDAYALFTEKGFTGTVNEFKEYLKNYQDGDCIQVIMTDYDTFTMTVVEAARALYNDSGSDTRKDCYKEVSTYDIELAAEYEEIIDYNSKLMEILEDMNLPEWKSYFANTLLGFKKVLENESYEFWFNVGLTSFKLVEKSTKTEWYSNPQTDDENASKSTIQSQKSILNVSFSKLASKSGTYGSYEYSVSRVNMSNDPLDPDFKVFIDEDNSRVQVIYHLATRGIDYTYFPKDISEVRINEIIAQSATRKEQGLTTHSLLDKKDNIAAAAYKKLINGYYKLITTEDAQNEFGYNYYEIADKYENMSLQIRNSLYEWMYNWCGYNADDLMKDNLEFNNETSVSNPDYTIAISYTLTDSGLEVSVPGNAIKENSEYPITTVDILPYFTATHQGIEGYTVIPDGSGAILNHDNNKTNYVKYSKRVYTTDLTKTTYVKTSDIEDLMFPMYAVVNTGNSSGILVEGLESSAQLALTADVSGRIDSYNQNYYTAYLREVQKVVIGSSYYKNELNKWTNRRMSSDVVLKYTPLQTDELSYSGVALKYRDILVNRYGLKNNDTTDTPVLDMDIIGSYSYTEHFLGIPYTAKSQLTTIDQLSEMIDTYLAMNIQHINAFYFGWRNTALKDVTFSSIKVSSLIGGKKKLIALTEEYKNNVTLYPYVNFGEVNKYQESFGNFHYTTRGVSGSYVVRQPYNLNSNVYDKTKPTIQVISPRYYLTFATELSENYSKTLGLNTLSVNELGTGLAGDYKKGVETYKTEAVVNQIASLEKLNSEGITSLNLYTPYDYAFKYTKNAQSIPYQATQYEILDYSVPFYQMVASGLFDYSGFSVNANSEQTLQKHIMDMIQTGSNMSFTFSYDSPSALLQSDYNTYYYTLYTEWLEEVQSAYNQLNSLGISKCRLVNHDRLANNVYEVTYKSDNQTIRILLNYNQASVTAKGYTIPAASYVLED